MPLLKGSARHIVAANVIELKRGGMSEAQATHLALKHARKGNKAATVAKAVVSRQAFGPYGAKS